MTTRHRLLVLAGATAASLALVLGPLRADQIRLVPGSSVKGKDGVVSGQITSESATQVKIKPTVGAEVTVPVEEIAVVTYDNLPPSYLLAESRTNAGALAEAADLFGKAADEAKDRPLVGRSAAFRRASTLAELALVDPEKSADAVAALEGYLKSQANSRQVLPALTQLMRIHLRAGDTAKAEAALDQLAAKVPTASGRVAIYRARILGRKGDQEGALKELDGLLATAPAGSAPAREAALARAESLAALKRYDEAEKAVRDLIASADPEDADLQAEAHNTLGDCLRAAGRPKDALLAYLKTDVLFSAAKDQHARALSEIAALWRELKQDGRANEVRERLRQQYPRSAYAQAGPAR
jgi:tetratricopeptide (TPR) repeat protein